MTIRLPSTYDNVMLLPGALLSGLSVYFILSNLLVPIAIAIPVSVLISIVVFGLTKFSIINDTSKNSPEETAIKWRSQITNNEKRKRLLSSSDIIFVAIYITLLIIVGFISKPITELFNSWNQFSLVQIVQLVAAIPLCFFAPGYAIVNIIDNRRREFKPLLRFLLAYVFSILITGLSGYISALFGYTVSQTKLPLMAVEILILLLFIAVNLRNRKYSYGSHFLELNNNRKRWALSIRKNSLEILVFASLLTLVMLSTYYLYHGVIIGDQWFHHGRSLLFVAGAFTSVSDILYPFFFHSLLATFFSLSGVPSVNAYVSINFLNILPVFAFYFFFKKWIPRGWRRTGLLAATLFMLGSGFGWVNVLSLITAGNHITSQHSALNILQLGELKTSDILHPSTFIDTASPEPTGPLILITLPLGFILLGIIKEDLGRKSKYFVILVAISGLGILSHDEFYLFIIIASILPLTFRLPHTNAVFAAFLFSISIVILSDSIFPVKYYTARHILGVPLIALCFLFVAFMWALYASRIFSKGPLIEDLSRLTGKILRIKGVRLALGVTLVAVASYLYVFTFIVWGQLPLTEVNTHSWYMYPLKFGVPGLLGFAFILSSLFKRYEKEVFIFGLIAIIAFLTGPYYDEFRFSKYVMVGMVGFASLLVYKIIFSIQRLSLKPLLSGLIMGLVVTSSSLSVLLFMGYTALALNNPDFEEFHKHLPRRIFPSPEDIRFLNFLHNDLINLKTDYVTIPADWWGINSNLEGFVGTSLASLPRFLQSPFTLNASSLEGFYNLLNFSNSRYIILPKGENVGPNIAGVTRFALENFQEVYQNGNHYVLAIPPLAPPSQSSPEVAMIYKRDGSLLSLGVSLEKILPYSDELFEKIKDSKFVKIGNKNGNEPIAVTLYSDKKRTTFWSKPLQENESINYIQSTFRIIHEDKARDDYSGVVWQDQNKEYYVSVSEGGLRLSEKSLIRSDNNKEILLSQNREIAKEIGITYILKVLAQDNSIIVYLDDIPRLQVTTNSTDNKNISKVGIRSYHNVAEFEPIKTGQIYDPEGKTYQKEIYYHHYYPLNALALSKTAYDTFVDGDFSALSKKIGILTWDPEKNMDNNKYLKFVNEGGTLAIINTEKNYNGQFSKLMSIEAGNQTKFDSISLYDNGLQQVVKVSGLVRNIESKSSGALVKSFYTFNNQMVAPFVIEKAYGQAGGRIIFVNAAGYFDSVFRSPDHLFLTLSKFPSLMGLQTGKYTKATNAPTTAIIGARFIGDLKISGNAVINSSALLLPTRAHNFFAKDISIWNTDHEKYQRLENHSRNLQIGNLTVSGAYEAILKSTGVLHLPAPSSQYDYIGIPILVGSNLTLRLGDRATAEFTIRNDIRNYSQPVMVVHGGTIQFHNINEQGSFPEIQDKHGARDILMKSPQIKVDGNISFSKLYNPNRPFDKDRSLYTQGKLITKFDHVDNYRENYRNVSRSQFLTYLAWTQIEANTNRDSPVLNIKIPGDIYGDVKESGIEMTLRKAMGSSLSFVSMISIIITSTIAIWRLWPNIKK